MTGWVEPATKKLNVFGNFSMACAVAERHVVDARGVDDSEPLIAGRRCWTFEACMVKVYDQANVFKRSPHKRLPVPPLPHLKSDRMPQKRMPHVPQRYEAG